MDYLDRIKGTDWRQEQSRGQERVLAHSVPRKEQSKQHQEGWKQFKRRHPIVELAAQICEEEGQPLPIVMSPNRTQEIAAVRHRIFYEARERGYPVAEIGRRMGVCHTSVCYGAKAYAVRNNLPPLDNYSKQISPKRLYSTLSGQNNRFAKLTNEQAIEIFSSSGPSHEVAKRYNISPSAVRKIRAGTAWRSVTNDA